MGGFGGLKDWSWGEYRFRGRAEHLCVRNKQRRQGEERGRIKGLGVGTSLEVQWLGLRASTAGGMGSIPSWGAKIPQAARCGSGRKGLVYEGRSRLVK